MSDQPGEVDHAPSGRCAAPRVRTTGAVCGTLLRPLLGGAKHCSVGTRVARPLCYQPVDDRSPALAFSRDAGLRLDAGLGEWAGVAYGVDDVADCLTGRGGVGFVGEE